MTWTDTAARTFPRRYPTAGVLAPRERPDWMDQGACKRKTALFFPGEHARDAVDEAKRICAGCPVVSECLAYALANEEVDGVWGATSGEQRRRMLKTRMRTA